MEKISRILPANHRTRAVDVSSSQPVRPGAPAWGRKIGRAQVAPLPPAIEDRLSLQPPTTAEKASVASQTTYKNTAMNARARVVDDLAKKFFETNPKTEVRESDRTLSEQVVDDIADLEVPSTEAVDTAPSLSRSLE